MRLSSSSIAAFIVMLAGGLTLTQTAAPAAPPPPPATSQAPTRSLDVTSVAIPTLSEPVSTDEGFAMGRLSRNASTEVTSTATSNCDGCSASSSSVGIIYVSAAGTTRADNVATAWSSCIRCSSGSVAVQVVVLRSAGDLIAANNRSFAANVACDQCTTSAAAYQLVIVSREGRVFDKQAIEDLRQWAREQAGAMSTAQASQGLRRAAGVRNGESQLDELEARARDALGDITTMRRDADVHLAAAPHA